MMKTVSKALTAAALGVVAFGATSQSASAQTNLTFCNKTGARIFIAMVYQDPQTNRWMLSAWQNRSPGQCASAGMIKTGPLYYFAEKEGRTAFWTARANVERTYCVPPTRVRREMLGGNCAQGERSLGFRGRVAQAANYTFSFE